ncbi:sterol desaturase family protein [Pinirhizobacter soli]|uniref:sterol desaturase family protein n=1 Tax=Pinirhizobacter soli TaxID=2786953 RepID=UPI00202A21E4|nr:sterol desaturase family protein [Pinirhizobacter soli]
MTSIATLWNGIAAWLAVHVVEPALAFTHVGSSAGDPRDIAEAAMIAVLQVCLIAFVMRPLETWFSAERWEDRKLTRIDRTYTLLMLGGIFPLFSFLVLTPFANLLGGGSDASGPPAYGLTVWVPWFASHPYAAFAVYYIAYDFTYYWMHRAQHAIPWWWALHSMHHSQRQMSCWTNDRGNYLDGGLQSIVLALVGLALGVDASQFAVLMLLGELVQNFSHTNVRIGFGRVLDRVFVAPVFHRLHHMVVDPDRPGLHNCNFGQVFSLWDVLFGTSLYGEPVRPTGVGDPHVDADNGRGLVMMQWWTLRRFWGAFTCRAGWRLGEVAFDDNLRPVPVALLDLRQLHAARPATAALPEPVAAPATRSDALA